MSLDLSARRLSLPGPRSVNLKTSLMIRIVLVVLACFLLAIAMVLIETRQERRLQDQNTVELVAGHLALQRLWIESANTMFGPFPDLDIIVDRLSATGQCVRFQDPEGRMVRSHCIGSAVPLDEAPAWFAGLYGLLFPAGEPRRQDVLYKRKVYGTVLVSSDSKAAMARAWRALRQMFGLTAITVLSLCLLVYVAIGRALAPTKTVVAGLNRLAAGELTYRLPAFHLSELQRIGEVTNLLADKVEVTLSERARLAKRLVNAQEQERRSLARELHDEFAQNLAAISALAASLEKSADGAQSDLFVEAKALSRISGTMMTALRGTLSHLRPAELDQVGLVESLRQLTLMWTAGHRQRTRFELDAPDAIAPLSEETAIHIYRIAQEALTNAAKHAGAEVVRLGLYPLPETEVAPGGGVELVIEDDGGGRREAPPDLAGNGRGLVNMQERVAALGGRIAFEDRPGAGLVVRVRIPLGPQSETSTPETPTSGALSSEFAT